MPTTVGHDILLGAVGARRAADLHIPPGHAPEFTIGYGTRARNRTAARRRAVAGAFGVCGQTEAVGASAAVVRRSRRNVSGAFHTANMVMSAPTIT